MWKMFAFVRILPSFKPTSSVLRKMLLMLFVAGVGVGAFLCGRKAASQTTARPRDGDARFSNNYVAVADKEYTQGVVAYLCGNIPITRQELGEYLIERQGKERLEALVNRRIIELACRLKGIFVSDAEVEMQLADDLKILSVSNISKKDFENTILKKFNKTMYEWMEDIIRPRIAMNKLVRSEINIDADDIQKAYDACYGPKVECRMIVLRPRDKMIATKDNKIPMYYWEKIREKVVVSDEAFDQAARDKDIQLIDALRNNGGKAPAIHKNFGDNNIERIAFQLKLGEVSVPVEMPDGTAVILKCDKQILATPKALDDQLRGELYKNVLQLKISQAIPKKLEELRKWASPQILLDKQDAPRQIAAATMPEYKSPQPVALVPPPAAALNQTPAPVPQVPATDVRMPPSPPVPLVEPPPVVPQQPAAPPATPLPSLVPTTTAPTSSVNPFANPGIAPDANPAAQVPSAFPVPGSIPHN